MVSGDSLAWVFFCALSHPAVFNPVLGGSVPLGVEPSIPASSCPFEHAGTWAKGQGGLVAQRCLQELLGQWVDGGWRGVRMEGWIKAAE